MSADATAGANCEDATSATRPDLVRVEREGRIAVVQLNRPRVLNALSPEMMAAVLDAVEALDVDTSVHAIVVAGHDRAFVAGADIRGMQVRSLADVLTSSSARFWTRLAAVETPLIAAVSGPAMGGGCELALACDLVVASETATFAQSEIKVGILPGGGGTQRLARTIGKHRAMELVLTGCVVTAEEAERLGFVNRVVGVDRWHAEAVELAHRVATGPPLAIRMAKRAVLAAEETTLTAGMNMERRLLETAYATDDRREGMTAFLEKRPAEWSGS